MTDLRGLATLLSVIDHGSIHLAARALYISASTASRQIRALEEDFGAELLDRTQTGVTPTQAGLAVVGFARRKIGESELLVDTFGGRAPQVENLRIATTTALGQTLVADAVSEVLAATAGLRITVTYASSLEALRLLSRREAEVCVNFSITNGGAGGVSTTLDPPGIVTHARLETRNVVMVDAAHPLAGRDSLSIRDIADFPLATLPAGNTARMQIETAMRGLGRILSPALECSCPILMAKAVAGTRMVAMMSERTIPDVPAEAALRIVPIADGNLDDRAVQILGRTPQVESAALDALLTALKDRLPAS